MLVAHPASSLFVCRLTLPLHLSGADGSQTQQGQHDQQHAMRQLTTTGNNDKTHNSM
jgi:hypothetical protein